MAHKKIVKKQTVPDGSEYENFLIHMFINRILKNGKKSLAQRIFDRAMLQIQESTKSNSGEILKEAIKNVTPRVEVKSRRMRGSTYQVPKEISQTRGITLGLRWIIQAAKTRPERGMILRLANEIIDASKKSGIAVRKRDEMHRVAEANKAYARFKF